MPSRSSWKEILEHPKIGLLSYRKMGKGSGKFPGRIGWRLNVFLKLTTHKITKNKQQTSTTSIKAHQINLENLENHTILYLNWQKLNLTFINFIQIFKPFILFSVLYSQPKIGNFGVWHYSGIARKTHCFWSKWPDHWRHIKRKPCPSKILYTCVLLQIFS